MGTAGPYIFLDNVKNRFVSLYGGRARTAIAYAFNADFQAVLAKEMESANSRGRTDSKLSRLESEVKQTKDVMVQNIDKVLARGEKIELLVDKSDKLDQHAVIFRSEATALRKYFWWKNVKMWLVLFGVLAVIVYAILAFSCGGLTIPNCRVKSSSPAPSPAVNVTPAPSLTPAASAQAPSPATPAPIQDTPAPVEAIPGPTEATPAPANP
jgi:vesicle-associated membrane protein 7